MLNMHVRYVKVVELWPKFYSVVECISFNHFIIEMFTVHCLCVKSK